MAAWYVENGILKESGVAIREFGVNCPDLFLEWLAGASNVPTPSVPCQYQSNYATIFSYFQSVGIRAIKFTPTGYHPLTFTSSWINDKSTYLANLDALFASAETYGMRLVPYLVSSPAQIQPCYSEHLSAIGDSSSQTWATITDFATTLVNRYKNSSALAMWAFMGEADYGIQNSGQFANISTTTPAIAYSINASMGTPTSWSDPLDCFTQESILNIQNHLQSIVKTNDNAPAYSGTTSTRATCSGNGGGGLAVKRIVPLSVFLAKRLQVEVSDTMEVHAYADTNYNYSVDIGTQYENYLNALKKVSASVGKPVVLGEFGIPQNYSAADGDPRNFVQQQKRMLTSIAACEIQAAFLWNYPASLGTDINWSFNPSEASQNRGTEWTWFTQFNSMYKNSRELIGSGTWRRVRK